MKINNIIALKTTQLFLMCVGCVASVAFLAALQWWVTIIGLVLAASLWIVIYKMLEGFEIRKSSTITVESKNASTTN